MVDFKELLNRSPEEREKARRDLDRRIEAKQARNKMMIDKLYDQMARGCIDNAWAEGFIDSVHAKIHGPLPFLTEKQQAMLEKLFEEY